MGILGSLLLEQGKTREAEELYGKLSRSGRPAVQAQGEQFLGQCSLLQGKFNEGLRHYRSSVQKAAESGDLEAQGRYLLALAEAQSALDRNKEALATLAEIRGIGSRLDPDLPIINVIVAQKQYDTARKLLQEQVKRWSGKVSAAALERLSTSLEGTIALEQGNYREALKRIEAAAPGPGKEPPDSEALGRAYLGAGDATRAEAVFRRFTQDPGRFQDPLRYVRCLIRLGEASEKLGKKEEALAAYREALKWWGSADLPLREISDAREGLKRLGG